MTRSIERCTALAALAASSALLLATPAAAQFFQKRSFRADLVSYEEVPALSTPAVGRFRMRVDQLDQSAAFRLSYAGLVTNVRFAHIHFGAEGTNGGVSVWLCSNGGGPEGLEPCPQGEGTVTGNFTAENVVGPEGQGIGPGELNEILAAIREGVAYVNVHTDAFPSGEIRGQLR